MELADEIIAVREELIFKFAEWENLKFSRDAEWNPTKLNVYRALAKFVDYPQEYMAAVSCHEDPEPYRAALKKMKLLNSLNGYTIYRMMLLKKEAEKG